MHAARSPADHITHPLPFSSTLAPQIQATNEALFPEIIALRRDLHAHPELAFEETRTAELVSDWLRKLGLEVQTGIARTGVVAWLHGPGFGPDNKGPVLALRADMDALPIQEQSDAPYASTHPGKMHACGHDVHTSSLLGTASILTQYRQYLHGSIQFVFQPSEEKLPGGAKVMIEEGLLHQGPARAILGQHVMPLLPAGTIGLRSGRYMASADEIYLTLHGRGGHGAQPHTTVDPVVVAAHIITALQTIVSRRADPRIPSVLTFGKLLAEGATNVIPPLARMEGTFRTFDEAWRSEAHRLIRQTVEGIAQAMDARAELDIRVGYPSLTNYPALADALRPAVLAYVGADRVVDLDLWMAAEDFAWYTQEIPGHFYRLGTRNEGRGIVHGLHTPQFDIDEDALRTAPGLMAWLALHTLAQWADGSYS